MRHLPGIVAALVSLQLSTSAQATATPAELADDAMARALWRIAVETQTRIGFESIEFVQPWGRWTDPPAFPYSSRDEALRVTVDADSRYAWRTVGDFVVVRPKNAWNDPANPFNRPMHNIVVENGTSSGVLSGLWDFIYTTKFTVQSGQLRPVSFEVPSGTVVDVLNRLTESADAVWWSACYRPTAQPDQRAPRWGLQMHLRDARMTIDFIEGPSPGGKK